MRNTAVLIVDDSVVVRRMLSRMIDEFPGFEVAASAASGPAALELISSRSVDVITLDVDMAPMNGLEFLDELKRRKVHLPVLMLSSLTSKGTEVTLEALLRGAADYIQKPSSDLPLGDFADELRKKLQSLVTRERWAPRPRVEGATRGARSSGRFSLVAIGASTGGPEALTQVLRDLPGDFPIPILIVQHMPPQFTGPFAQRLNEKCAVQVLHAEHGMRVDGGCVYVAPGGRHMVLNRSLGG
ncbi:MAG: chemotaxis protein CheB, partial [Myxococcota bacterium]